MPLPAQCFHAFWPLPLKRGPEDVLGAEGGCKSTSQGVLFKTQAPEALQNYDASYCLPLPDLPPFLCLLYVLPGPPLLMASLASSLMSGP